MENFETTTASNKEPHRREPKLWIVDILLISVLLMGAYFRFIGINWDGDQHLHPDERFLTMVASSVVPSSSLGNFFNTDQSTLNPHNMGYGFYVYGTLPLFMVRYIADWIGQSGYDQVNIVGRAVSAVMDLITVLLVFLITSRLYKNKRMALLAAAFSAGAVLQIQLAHYFAVDTFLTSFAFLAVYFAVRIMTADVPVVEVVSDPMPEITEETEDEIDPLAIKYKQYLKWLMGSWTTVIPFAFFGIALGMAVASKISAALIAGLLPLAVYIWYAKLPKEQREYQGVILIRNLVIAGIFAFLAFRIFQPYAFSGPGFFGLGLNEKWVANMKEVANQTTGDVDFPPALQWARRPIWFAWQNMVEWGLGLPLGILAWGGFLWMGWKILRDEWQKHLLLWIWTGFYFTFQSISLTSSMRYQMLVYPSLTIIAAWAVFTLWEKGDDLINRVQNVFRGKFLKGLAWVIGASVLILTLTWAYAFTRIYTRPVTRVAASEWIYQNVPGPINLRVETKQGLVNQPLAFRNGANLDETSPIIMYFTPQISGTLTQITFAHIVDLKMTPGLKNLVVILKDKEKPDDIITTSFFTGDFPADGDPRGKAYPLIFATPIQVSREKTYRIEIVPGEPATTLTLAGSVTLKLEDKESAIEQPLAEPVEPIKNGKSFTTQFSANQTGDLKEVFIPRIVDWEEVPEEKTLVVSVSDPNGKEMVLGSAEIKNTYSASSDPRGSGYTFVFKQPIPVVEKKNYGLKIELDEGNGAIAIYGSRQAIESTWDDPLPLGLEGYNPYDYYSGVYRSDLNFEMYWDDNQDKFDRFLTILNQADYLFISSNRQWGTTIRVPERYPLTTTYYQNLIGCPEGKDIFWCYSVARPGMFKGQLGYDLEAVFQSEPTLGTLEFNTQFAEEAFSVYDHPKVLIFKKNADFNIETARSIFSSVDLSQVIHVTPKKAGSLIGNLMLSADAWKRQLAGGTWSELFNRDGLQNKYPVIGVVFWYMVILLLGWVTYPLLRIAMKGLPDRGYPFAKLAGMVLLAYLVWMGSSLGISFSRLSISAAFLVLFMLALILAYRQRKSLAEELKSKWKYLLTVEGIFLLLFVIFLLVRLGNPDLWHPYKGGEKPMDFSYLNAVIKSTTFPPYDPWFGGGYINYYYYGFVIVGVLVKWLGIIPAIAYNIIVPTLFALVGMGAFSIGWNLLSSGKKEISEDNETPRPGGFLNLPLLGGIGSTVGMLILGNLGTIRMIWQGFQRLAAPGGVIDDASVITHWMWSIRGFFNFVAGAQLGFPAGDWYWVPSRAIPGEPITEFPLFTFLYADLHAHMIALPITLLALGWALSILLGKWNWDEDSESRPWLAIVISLLFGALIIGTLRPTNTWDFPTYLAIGSLALIYTILRYAKLDFSGIFNLSIEARKTILAILSVGTLILLSFLFYQPFTRWFAQGYNAVRLWDGSRTPFWSYFTHWGLFLFLNISFMVWETRDWLATTPASALNKLKPYMALIWIGIILTPVVAIGLTIYGIAFAWLVIPLLAWIVVLICRSGISEMKRFSLFIFGCALFLSTTVELITLEGDIGRMNTVFKFYMQAWTFMSISAGASLIWLYPAIKDWLPGWRNGWSVACGLLIGSAALFPMTATIDKIRDRMNPFAPHTLDGMSYMETATYQDIGGSLDLNQDYKAIQWMQDNVKGSPVIVEGNTVEYRWGSRFTIYTGLPGVVGWNWHQRQQRGVVSADQVTNRVNAIGQFYLGIDRAEAAAFLNKYNVEYIIVGQLEKMYYPGMGLDKFPSWNGELWDEVYRDRDTVIYKVKR